MRASSTTRAVIKGLRFLAIAALLVWMKYLAGFVERYGEPNWWLTFLPFMLVTPALIYLPVFCANRLEKKLTNVPATHE